MLSNFLLWASEAIIVALIGAVWRLWFAHMRFREEVAKTYALKAELEVLYSKNSNDLAIVKSTMEKILGMVHEIKGSLHGVTRD
jgi:hypothetical protein